jgi:hypothetical protein
LSHAIELIERCSISLTMGSDSEAWRYQAVAGLVVLRHNAGVTPSYDLAAIRLRLDAIAEAGRHPEVARTIEIKFGYDITPPIGPTLDLGEIEEIEREYAIELPPDHRRFLSEVADGGLGPFSGWMTLNEGLDQAGQIGAAFRPGPSTGRCAGALPLCDYGCGMVAVLVLAGSSRGAVWMNDPNTARVDPWYPYKVLNGPIDDVGVLPDPAQARPYGFVDWFDEWASAVSQAIESL